jgi:predicted DNA-binding transcriptional regulator YafY
VASQYPTEAVEELGGGRLRVSLRVSGDAWLARLLLRLGPDAEVVEGDPAPAAASACRILRRYRGGAP